MASEPVPSDDSVNKGKTCAAVAENCDRPAKAKGYCSKHLHRFNTTGSPYMTLPPNAGRPAVNTGTCKATEDNCQAKAITKGYCAKHYERVRKYGDPYHVVKPRKTKAQQAAEKLAKPPVLSLLFPLHNPQCTVEQAFRGAAQLLPNRLARRGKAAVKPPQFALLQGQGAPGSDGAPFVVVANVPVIDVPDRRAYHLEGAANVV